MTSHVQCNSEGHAPSWPRTKPTQRNDMANLNMTDYADATECVPPFISRSSHHPAWLTLVVA